MSVCPWISLDRESSWSWFLRKNSNQFYIKPVLVYPNKAPDSLMDLQDIHTYDYKKRVGIWKRMNVVPVEYEDFDQTVHLTMWFFQFITGINFKWDYFLRQFIALLVQIGLCTKLRIYRVPTDKFKWYCCGYEYLW